MSEVEGRSVIITPELINIYSLWHQNYAPKCGGGTKNNNHCKHWYPFIAGFRASAEIGVAKLSISGTQ